MLTEIAEALTWIARVAYEGLHKNQRDLIDTAYADAARDVESFKRALLDHCTVDVQLMLDGLMFGIKVDITTSDLAQLRSIKLGDQFDAYDLLGLYCRARGAEFAQRVSQILTTTGNNS
jgi:hypothetical protein